MMDEQKVVLKTNNEYIIAKEFKFEAGHRVWAQELNDGVFNEKFENKCKHLHGHSYKVKVYLKSSMLNEYGVVVDFTHIKNYMKELIDKLDHSFIIDINDPLYITIKELSEIFDLKLYEVDFVPTAENIAKYIYDYLQVNIKHDNVEIDAIEVFETTTSLAIYKKINVS